MIYMNHVMKPHSLIFALVIFAVGHVSPLVAQTDCPLRIALRGKRRKHSRRRIVKVMRSAAFSFPRERSGT
jgi:hypothetical protein